MKTSSIVFLAVIMGLTLVTACAHQEEVPVVDEPAGYERAMASFRSAYRELETTIRATPDWETRPQTTRRARGMAQVAERRAEALRPWVLHGRISAASIALITKKVGSSLSSTPRP